MTGRAGGGPGRAELLRRSAGLLRAATVVMLLLVLVATVWIMRTEDRDTSAALASQRVQDRITDMGRIEWEQVAARDLTAQTSQELAAARANLEPDLALLRRSGLRPDRVRRLDTLTHTYLVVADQVDGALQRGDAAAASRYQSTLGEPAFDAARSAAQGLVAAAQDEATVAKTRTRIAVLVLALLPMLTLVLPAWLRARRRSFRYESRLNAMIGHAADPFIEFDGTGVLRTWSPQAEAVLGWSEVEVLGRHVSEVLFPRRKQEIEQRLAQLASGDWAGLNDRQEIVITDARGDERWFEMTIWPSVIAGSTRMSGFLHDITERRRLEAELRAEAENDSLTGLCNRRTFQRKLHEVCARNSRHSGAVIFLDLDHFKMVNDTYGHRMGDRILQATAARIRQAVASFEGVVAARFGGDEFAVLVPEINRAEARWLAASLVSGLNQRFTADEHEILISTSVGLVVMSGERCRAEDVMRDADLAMYAAKARGRNGWAEFEPAMYEVMSADTRLEAELRAALLAGTVEVHYQPVVTLPFGRPHSVEALARWDSPELGAVPPARFIPLAEQRNLIGPVGAYVLSEACFQLARWRAEHGEQAPKTVSVNVSVEQLRDRGFPDVVRQALDDAGLAPADLVLELTESVETQDPLVIEGLQHLHRLGVGLAVDDFGTGHSSLARLRELPVDVLKVEGTFLSRIDERGSDPLVSAIVSMAEGLKLDVVVEGIETTAQAEYVSWLGCTYGQGFLYSPALAPDDLMTWWLGQLATGGIVPRPRQAASTTELGRAEFLSEITGTGRDRTPRSE